MNAFVTFVLVVIIVAGMIIVAQGVGVDIIGEATQAASHCVDMLNATGQVVQTVCQ